MKRLCLLGMALLLAAPAFSQEDIWRIDAGHSSAQFAVRYMMVSTVRGEFAKMEGSASFDGKDISSIKVEAKIDTNTINTRNENRDKHLRSADFFEVEKFPTIEFKSKRVESSGSGKFNLVGDLTMKGITKEVVLEVEGPSPVIADRRGKRIGASATTTINRQDFDIVWNRALDGGGIVVGDEIKITIDLSLIQRAPRPSGRANP